MADREIIIETPRGAVIHKSIKGGGLQAQVVFYPEAFAKLKSQFHSAQAWLDTAILRDTEPFVPMITGALKDSGILGTVIGTGWIRYIAPYAHSRYYAPTPPSKEVHPQACRYWFEASKAIHGERWIGTAKNFVKGER